jgi:hypothetical protein
MQGITETAEHSLIITVEIKIAYQGVCRPIRKYIWSHSGPWSASGDDVYLATQVGYLCEGVPVLYTETIGLANLNPYIEYSECSDHDKVLSLSGFKPRKKGG